LGEGDSLLVAYFEGDRSDIVVQVRYSLDKVRNSADFLRPPAEKDYPEAPAYSPLAQIHHQQHCHNIHKSAHDRVSMRHRSDNELIPFVTLQPSSPYNRFKVIR
jgi:hypothetical protein